MRLIDLSHPIEDGMTTYPGLPGPEISEHLSFEESHRVYAPGTEFSIGHISMVANTGTYLDTPAHRYRDGYDLAGLKLEKCAHLPMFVIDASGAIGKEALAGLPDLAGAAVIFRTGWDAHWGTQSYADADHPYLGREYAEELVERRVALVGIDSVNIDNTKTDERPVHSVLLGAGTPIVEHLTHLGDLPQQGWFFYAVPPMVRRLATFPVRAFALEP